MCEQGLEQRRIDMLDQLRYLLDEIAALRQMTSRMHEEWITNIEGGPSVKQCYGAIIMRDRNETLPALKKLLGHRRSKKFRDADWNRLPMEEILTEVEKARHSVIEAADKLDAMDWTQEVADGVDVYELLLSATHKDTDTLRNVAQKLYRDYS